MGNFTYLVILSITLATAHLTNAGLIADKLIEKSELYYITPSGQVPLADVQSFLRNKLVIYCHGFIANPTHDSIMPVRSGLLAAGIYDVIACDWSPAAKLPYLQARSAIGPVANFLYGKLSKSLLQHNISLEDITCIGHSLGAHVCGNIGKASGGRVGQIVALDPAKPSIKVSAPDCLQKEDGIHVVVLHTGAPFFGQMLPLGHIDFYSDLGVVSQPGCIEPAPVVDFFTKGNACSHDRAPQVCGESIVSTLNFPAIPCGFPAIEEKSMAECQKNQTTKYSQSALQSDIVDRHVGINVVWFNLDIPKGTTGTFIMSTNPRPPFGMGANYRVPEDYA